jgi:hypothetical protein
MRKTSALLAVPLVAVALISLSGCAVLDVVRHETGGTFDTTMDLTNHWDKSAPWVPADSSDIQTRESTQGDPAILRAVTTSELDPALCVEVERQSGPSFEQDWSVDPYAVDTVWACGDWAVIPTDDGWYGWTPSHPDEKAQSPSS